MVSKKFTEKVFHVISNTHWDREWRFPYQRNRQFLVEMIDSVIDILENDPDYRAFHLDSQTVVLNDYLQIRPHKREVLEKLISEKRLLAGPWYILPDEFMVSGESLVRNLLLGHRIASAFGHVSKTGYSPFSWGQISQLPQIYKGFGIDVIMFYRGMNSLDSPDAEFMWTGADGSSVLASRFSHWPRYNFYFYVYRPVFHNEMPSQTEHPSQNGEVWFHCADPGLAAEDYHIIGPENGYFHENIQKSVTEIIEKQAHDFTTRHVIWMEGHDSSGPNPATPRLIRDIRAEFPGLDVRHSTLEEYIDCLKKEVDPSRLPVVSGERRSAQYDNRSGNLFGYITSARTYLKTAHFDAERKLEKYAEPIFSLACRFGLDPRDRSLDEAWRLLLENTAHDSIGGCSLDTVHEDMMNRYKQAAEISDAVYMRSLMHFLKPDRQSGEMSLYIWNPLPRSRHEITELFLDIPLDRLPDNSREKPSELILVDQKGRKTDLEILAISRVDPVLEQLSDRPMYFRMLRYHVLADVTAPPLGFNRYSVLVDQNNRTASPEIAYREDPVLENDILKVLVHPDGSFDMTCKKSGRIFTELGIFEDEGESGHAWVHESLGPVISSAGGKADIEFVRQTSFEQSIRIRSVLAVPANLEQRKNGICTAELILESLLTLRKNSSVLEINVTVVNSSEDHRLRLKFPSGIAAKHHWAQGQFDVVQRPVARPDTSNWVEQPMYDWPFYHFADISDLRSGLALLSDGLKEYEVADDHERTLFLTLIRAFRYVIQPASVQDFGHQKGSQMPGTWKFRLGLMPHSGDWQEGGILEAAQNFAYSLRAAQTNGISSIVRNGLSLVGVSPSVLYMDALKPAEDGNGLVLRIHNPSASALEAAVHLGFPVKRVSAITLEEFDQRRDPILSENEFRFTIGSREITTFRLE